MVWFPSANTLAIIVSRKMLADDVDNLKDNF